MLSLFRLVQMHQVQTSKVGRKTKSALRNARYKLHINGTICSGKIRRKEEFARNKRSIFAPLADGICANVADPPGRY